MKLGKILTFGVSLALILAAGFTVANLKVPAAWAAVVCPEFRGGDLSASDVAVNPDRVREEDPVKKACSSGGVFGWVECAIAQLFADLTGNGTLNLRDSQMPGYLRTANELALSGDPTSDEPGELTGGIAKMLIPGYKQDELDPLVKLTESEGQLVTGTINLNNNALQRTFTEPVYEEESTTSERGYYDLQVGSGEEISANYQAPGRFGEVAPLYNRFGLLKQALMPSAGTATIPDLNQNCANYDPSVIAVTGFVGQNPQRNAPWTAYKPIPEEDRAGEDVECSDEGVCPSEVEGNTYTVGGNLDTQTNVALASDAWERIGAPSNSPGQGGVFNILLPPGASFRTTDATSQLSYGYTPHSDAVSPTAAILNIADLGNVRGSTACIVNALTEHPARASSQACNQALETPFGPVSCTEEATPLEFPNTAGSAIARRAWEIVNRLYQGFWCLWNWSKDDYPEIFDEDEFQRNPNPPYPPDHYIAMFWCTELVRHTHNNLSLSLVSEDMARQFGAQGPRGGPYQSGGRFTSISDATWQNIQAGYVVFFIVPGPTAYRLNHVGIVYSVSRDGLTIVQSNAGTKSLLIPVGDNGRISGTVGNFRVMGFGRP